MKLRGELHGVKICINAHLVSHIFFVDDSMIFTKTTHAESIKNKQIIQTCKDAFR